MRDGAASVSLSFGDGGVRRIDVGGEPEVALEVVVARMDDRVIGEKRLEPLHRLEQLLRISPVLTVADAALEERVPGEEMVLGSVDQEKRDVVEGVARNRNGPEPGVVSQDGNSVSQEHLVAAHVIGVAMSVEDPHQLTLIPARPAQDLGAVPGIDDQRFRRSPFAQDIGIIS